MAMYCMYIMCTPGDQGNQKWAFDSLELKLQMAVNPHVGTEYRIQVLWKHNQFS